MSSSNFFLGRPFDLEAGQSTGESIYYDPADLTTHAVITGMTGSGKTGLCIALMEEAALQGIPAIIIDVKGDLTNLLLHFPDQSPTDFQPWLDADSIRRQGKSLEQAASDIAQTWSNGLAGYGIGPERIRALKNAVQFGVFSPGSDAGLQISVLSSLQSPDLPWEGNREILREKIASTVTALLGLVGYTDVDPLRSREHILLSNIFENAWSQNIPLDLTELVLQVQNPPFDKLGAFAVEAFFPSKDRTELAMTLNNILASPAFQTWREGLPMHIPDLLFTPEGRPRHSIFYIAHLSEGERMFFVTLLLSAFETWMRTQAGSASLRALLYFDELFGYLPPQRNPPSKTPLLRMLKQARAFGVGLVLATQNPADLDYKALSNAGTWFVGKLQTEWDKQRLLDGLQSATADLDRAAYNKIISALGKRVFLLHNIHQREPVLFQTRWAMNFLAGPLTRAQLPALNRLAGARVGENAPGITYARAASPAPAAVPSPGPGAADLSRIQPVSTTPAQATAPNSNLQPANSQPSSLPGSITRPAVPVGVRETFLPLNYSLTEAFNAAAEQMPFDARQEGILYRPTLLAAARAAIRERRYGVDSEIRRAALVDTLERGRAVRWEDFPYAGPSLDRAEATPAPGARFASLDSALGDARLLNSLQKDFLDWVYRSATVTARVNETLKVYAGPDVSPADFRKACAEAARDARDRDIAKLTASLERQLATLRDKLAREERELRVDESELQNRKWEENATHAENVFGLFTGRGSMRKVSTSMTKRRMTEQAKAEVDESLEAITLVKSQIIELEQRRADLTAETNDRWASVVNQVREIPVMPKKADIFVEIFGLGWMPFYLIRGGGELYELPAFGPES